jgi:hypothetical protein
MIAGPILAMTIGIDVITAVTTAVMTGSTTTDATTATTGTTTTEVIVVMIAMMIVTTTNETTDVMIDVARTTTVTTTTTVRSGLRRHRPKGATPMVRFRRPTVKSTSSSVVSKRSKVTDRLDQTPGRSGTSTLKTHNLCGGLNSQSLSPGKIIGFTSLTPGLNPMVVNPIVNGAWLPKTLIDGGSSLNIIFTETLRKMEFDFNKMTACDEPFCGVVPSKAAYPIGHVCLPITFSTEENFCTEYLTFEARTSALQTTLSSDDLCSPSSWPYPTTPTSS